MADLSISASLFAMACSASREHSRLAAIALDRYGDHGALISGCVRDHFPAPMKDSLRRLANACTDYSDAAWLARPKRVRRDTMRNLARDIATRDGSGFYGPQPRVAANAIHGIELATHGRKAKES